MTATGPAPSAPGLDPSRPLDPGAGPGRGAGVDVDTGVDVDPGIDRGTPFDLDAAWTVHPQVAVRPEPFGALLYHFGTRRLSLLRDRMLAAVVRELAGRGSAREASRAAGLDAVPPGVLVALARLERTGMIVRRTP